MNPRMIESARTVMAEFWPFLVAMLFLFWAIVGFVSQ
jgi:hypothetical protein